MTLDVRLAAPEEYAAVGALTASVYEGDGFSDDDYSEVLRDAAGRAAVADLLVAVLDGDLVGTVTLVGPDAPPEWREHYREGAATIRMLGVAPAARGRGAGRALVAECLTRARARGCREVTLLTQPTMHAAQHLYTGLGFVRDPSLDRPVRPDLQLWGYSLPLD